MPVVNSIGRQLALALRGAALIGGVLALRDGDEPSSPGSAAGDSASGLPQVNLPDDRDRIKVGYKRVLDSCHEPGTPGFGR